MTSGLSITRLPRPFDPDRGAEALAATPWAQGQIAELIAGAGGSAPYLKALITREGDWLEQAFEDPDDALQTEFAALSKTPPDQLPDRLRQSKRRVALLTALCDLSGIWPLERVTGAITDLAALATDLALKSQIAIEIRKRKLPGMTEDDLPTACGMVALAMGKMGAAELNYSSDIDLICLFDETRFARGDFHDARAAFVRATRRAMAMLSDMTGEGYVFRTDLRLRPDPAVTPVCLSMEAAERYYESLGRTWERAAYIKANPCAGDIGAGQRFLRALKPFVWRKHLDYAAIQDAHDMRLRIREHKGLHGPISLPGHNMKLGRGGIREIEFFTQTRQLIAGGRDPDLRDRRTTPGLAALAAKGWVPGDVAQTLTAHYRAHRKVEHRLQMLRDAQTHDLPKTDEGFDRLACLMGRDRAEMLDDIHARLTEVHELTEGFFTPDSAPKAQAGLDNNPIASRWPSYPALRSDRAAQIFDRLRPVILGKLSGADRPEEALSAFDDFLRGLPAGVQLFSLFEANPSLIDLLVSIVSASPDLARYLARNSGVFDAVIGGDFFAPWPGKAALFQSLANQLEAEPDYERQLDLARRWGKEWHFRTGVHLLRGLMEPEEAGRAYADLAEATLAALWPQVQTEFARKHGQAPGRGAVVLGMGSLGSGRLHAQSDLDVIVIYDAEGIEMSEGRRPLAARTYYARLTQALITAMTAPMAEGRLYEVDMRLRPSGNQGPVATSWQSFQSYQRSEAWIWEHLALTRARVIAGPPDLRADVEAFRLDLLSQPRDKAAVLSAVAEMCARIQAAKAGGGPLEAKLGPGRMQDIELLAQAASLLSGRPTRHVIQALRRATILPPGGAERLAKAYGLAWSVQVGTKLIGGSAAALGQGGADFLAGLAGQNDLQGLTQALELASSEAAEVIDATLPELGQNGAET